MAAPPDAATGSRAPLIGDSSRAPQKRQNPQKLRRSRPGALGSRLLRPQLLPVGSRQGDVRCVGPLPVPAVTTATRLRSACPKTTRRSSAGWSPRATRSSAGSPARPPTSGNGAVMLHRAALRAGRRGRHLPPPGRQDRRGLVFGGLPVPPSAARLVHGTAPGRREFPRHRSEPCRSRRSFPTLKRSTTSSAAATARPERRGRPMARAGSPALRPPAR